MRPDEADEEGELVFRLEGGADEFTGFFLLSPERVTRCEWIVEQSTLAITLGKMFVSIQPVER